MIYKTRQEVLRAAVDWMDVCIAAGIVANVKHFGMIFPIQKIGFLDAPENYEFPLALLEGNEVWVGSKLYDLDTGTAFGPTKISKDHLGERRDIPCFFVGDLCQTYIDRASWNPPKPKIVMVEMLVEDAKYIASHVLIDAAQACKKALEKL